MESKDYRLIDAHNHPDWHGHGFDRFIENMDRFGIEKAWLLSWDAPAPEWDQGYADAVAGPLTGGDGPIPFCRCLAYVERAPERFVLGYAPDPRRGDAVARLKAAVEIYGVRVCCEVKVRMMYDNPDALRLFRFCGEAGLPVVVHIDYELGAGQSRSFWYGGGIEALERALEQCPRTVFLGHAPGFWAHISGDDAFASEAYPKGPVKPGGRLVDLLRRFDNLYCDLSAGSGRNALERDRGFATGFLGEFQDRVLFGRDCFDDQLQKFLDSLGLESALLRKIYHDNACALIAGK